jgi:hypothetical protein
MKLTCDGGFIWDTGVNCDCELHRRAALYEILTLTATANFSSGKNKLVQITYLSQNKEEEQEE